MVPPFFFFFPFFDRALILFDSTIKSINIARGQKYYNIIRKLLDGAIVPTIVGRNNSEERGFFIFSVLRYLDKID